MDELLNLLGNVLDVGPIDADTALISSGLIDSFTIVGLLMELESHYGVVVDPEEIDASSFDTPRQMYARISSQS